VNYDLFQAVNGLAGRSAVWDNVGIFLAKHFIFLLFAAGVVYLLEMLDRRVRSRSDLEQKLAVPSLGGISKWQPMGGRLLPSPTVSAARATRALPHPW